MSINNVTKQLEKDVHKFTFHDKTQTRKAFLLTDTKGRYLLKQVDIIFESGANRVTSDRYARQRPSDKDRQALGRVDVKDN